LNAIYLVPRELRFGLRAIRLYESLPCSVGQSLRCVALAVVVANNAASASVVEVCSWWLCSWCPLLRA